MGDRFLDSFREAKKNEKKTSIKKEESCLSLDTFDIKKARDIILRQKDRSLTQKEKEVVMRVARKMLNATKKEFGVCHGYYILLGAEYAEKVGEGGSSYVKNRLLEAYKKNPGMFDATRVEAFFIRNREAAVNFKKIVGRIFPRINYLFAISFVYLVLGMFFLTTTLTGYSIHVGDFNASGLLGGILFVFGVFGFYVSFRKKS